MRNSDAQDYRASRSVSSSDSAGAVEKSIKRFYSRDTRVSLAVFSQRMLTDDVNEQYAGS